MSFGEITNVSTLSCLSGCGYRMMGVVTVTRVHVRMIPTPHSPPVGVGNYATVLCLAVKSVAVILGTAPCTPDMENKVVLVRKSN